MDLVAVYLTAKETVIDRGFAYEIDWQAQRKLSDVTETDFLREAAWVVISSGMRESVVRAKFGEISTAFFEWSSAMRITRAAPKCVEAALGSFRHKGKMEAIANIAGTVALQRFVVQEKLEILGVDYLRTLPYMGPATSYHLAKNLGLDVVKPDRHLLRISQQLGFSTPAALCTAIRECAGDSLAVIDLVLWRYSTFPRASFSHLVYASNSRPFRSFKMGLCPAPINSKNVSDE